MQENKSQVIPYAMRYGLVLGAFWVVKYLCVIGADKMPFLGLLSTVLSIFTPLLLLLFLVKYRQEALEGVMGYGQGVRFSILLFLFASFLEMVMIVAHTMFIDPNFIARMFASTQEMLKAMQFPLNEVEGMLPSPFQYAFASMMVNVLIGAALSLVLVPVSQNIHIQRFTKNNQDTNL